ncbi:MAG: hypothetical protein DMG40_27785 [Acidobacteria bacterium]|nr:MAG: hypothetical protein DMG40_27785 [Acidobacteriota bacterium]
MGAAKHTVTTKAQMALLNMSASFDKDLLGRELRTLHPRRDSVKPPSPSPSNSVKRHLPIEYAADLTPVVAAKEARASWNARGMAETA